MGGPSVGRTVWWVAANRLLVGGRESAQRGGNGLVGGRESGGGWPRIGCWVAVRIREEPQPQGSLRARPVWLASQAAMS